MSATISCIYDDGAAVKAGLQKGDIIQSINGQPVRDAIDFMFFSQDDVINFRVKRGGRSKSIKVKNNANNDLGLEIKTFRTKSCRNKCLFCFVDQLPRGMRKTLYLKDDDYRMSFLYGNYITITNLTSKDKERIISQRLSPLYISVHTTDDVLRKKMLGNAKAPNILKDILELAANKIRLHIQIVICPGYNDGNELERTIRDLEKFYPYVASIAVVPVGLTRHRKKGIRPVEKKDAVRTIETVKKIRKRLNKRHGDPVVHIADEFYIKAGLPFPSLKEYGDLPQIENGVGLVPLFLQSAKKLKMPKKIKPINIALFTGSSFMPFLKDFTTRLKTIEGLSVDLLEVENKFFGKSVTVTGLLTGKDILKATVGKTNADCLLVPDVTLRDGEDVFLDNVTLKDLEESLGMKVRTFDSTPEGLLKEIKDGCERQD